jgi:hypothetical protein
VDLDALTLLGLVGSFQSMRSLRRLNDTMRRPSRPVNVAYGDGGNRTEILIAWQKAFCYDSAALESYGIIL